jgi:hypothetical protein
MKSSALRTQRNGFFAKIDIPIKHGRRNKLILKKELNLIHYEKHIFAIHIVHSLNMISRYNDLNNN